ncbi:hypothetical protein [Candidatus Methanoliparum sp. LAM-1]|uniref:hypothetical protein n=1 Tax=Candidatus Methanoliparum sp. LAM-1 TaxID=2874846 RepID=UPI001E62157C|nr:hypothetical protein [Candidatus Methanoliparum sp. LAM-1]BDC35788.1 hypothetical protein MTLP_04700 [Candidatus Methanoliparum sp. LAM-1]
MNRVILFIAALLIVGCVETLEGPEEESIKAAVNAMNAEALAENTKALSGDEMSSKARQ